ncbi:hypothetical protein [Nocardia seriolae]|uniref:Uncharacterized protein n=1 Tax=Nocardia seriolae TaxID=37332 RepID=A0A0B8N1S1_9NOCA|nr:hypothetical protein [Nocardia seriolae]APA98212.1 hypothetical protein NS506_04164 [Nocardia seriolae]MTJ62896.1 hypothetical protein [Nocardia seriolae]MTJ72665.1 hypothetical protein [Nocardia seriolae]MTJ87927.1 hypothetical protein [Nocardia seriolae]MTK31918.1 hypothetical protein [Nocardia seriolae]
MKKTIWANGLAVTAAALLASTGTANAALPTSMGSDSTFKVGVDIQPGVYKTTTALGVCAWARLSATTPGANATIEAGGAINGTVTVEIKPTDVAFFTSGCGTWTLQTTTTTSGSSGLGSGSSLLNAGSSMLSGGSSTTAK